MYERAVAQVPPSDEKRHWRRYIFLWLNYALFEELETKVGRFRAPFVSGLARDLASLTVELPTGCSQDLQRAREIYRACLKLVPHKKFTFAKVWVQFAEFEVRQQELDAARKILGMALGLCPKEKVGHLAIASPLHRR